MWTKQDIIKELQRYAKEIGKTPSQKVFFDNTEVGIYDRMRFWPNYGELVREAGLTPNEFDKTKYNHDQLCRLFIRMVRDGGKWPTRGILDVKHHSDLSFPDSSTFYKKLGLTSELAKTILKFVGDKRGYKDIVDICNIVIRENEDINFPAEEGVVPGYIYLGKQNGSYKIGKSKNPNRRREDITLLGSEPFELVHEIKTDDMNGVEKYWHERFKSRHKRGEWFNLTRTDISAFKQWKKIA
ncbi:MAG: hypothetical protein UV73_C0001G0052 [Candidatus Gottesmanbacteria bacterium GW2011_GWA2_43_14]|uniref:Bacteriophage T5 Orf172 DNA-binding domain-containing protein n=1 Tax=Candidatus Gottesmanbacteria bacterium GW2011_GWA2_43_14 TaxID=1618443 RepID=A0A0G1FU51_9BACT|nr:MAG: hypothetical protein UV73_C0001G0052 [Candidatus Gottesmanbacteria bacterium GW2011_GWA2_43_14]